MNSLEVELLNFSMGNCCVKEGNLKIYLILEINYFLGFLNMFLDKINIII